MIAVCDLCCSNKSHETPNLGFLYGLCLAFPDKEITFFSDYSLWKNLQYNAVEKNIDLKNISHHSIIINPNETILAYFWNLFVIPYIFFLFKKKKITAVLFLATNSFQNYIIKYISQCKIFSALRYAIVLHGALDSLTETFAHDTSPTHNLCTYEPKKALWNRLFDEPSKIFIKVYRKFIYKISNTLKLVNRKLTPAINFKKSLLYKQDKNINYIILSRHIIKALPQYIDISQLKIFPIPMPAVFTSPLPSTKNTYLKIAIFGYGNTSVLYTLNKALSLCNITKNYEIRIIGMDARGTSEFPHVTQPIKGVLSRSEMESMLIDIDMFLILYEKHRYTLSCSASIIEAHSYCKPILYLDNPCIDFFNHEDRPIGISCPDIEVMASTFTEIVNNYDIFKNKLEHFRHNIIIQREEIDIKKYASSLKDILS